MKKSLPERIARRMKLEVGTRRARLGTWIAGGTEFDYWSNLDNLVPGKPVDAPVGLEFVARAVDHLDFLKKLGLQPHHQLLDYGCSILRTAYHIVPYLDPGHYVGAEVSRATVRRGVHLMEGKGIDRSRYHLVNVRSPELTELEGFRFDYIFANSVLQYLSDTDIEVLFLAFRRLSNEGATVYGSFPEPHWIEALKKKGNYYRSPDAMMRFAKAAGFKAELLGAVEGGFPTAPSLLMTPRAG